MLLFFICPYPEPTHRPHSLSLSLSPVPRTYAIPLRDISSSPRPPLGIRQTGSSSEISVQFQRLIQARLTSNGHLFLSFVFNV